MTSRPARRLTFFTKPGCHLCEHVEDLLDDLRHDFDLSITSVDITRDLEIFERYKYEIPVVIVQGGGTVSGRVELADLRRALDTAS